MLRPLFSILSLLALSLSSVAAPKAPDPLKDYDETIFMDMELDQNIDTPEVPQKAQSAVSSKMTALYKRLKDKKYDVELMRNNDVVLVTVPSDRLFQPNDTLLSPEAAPLLTPLIAELEGDPMNYKFVYAVHTDNTGSEFYNNLLSQQRNNTIYDFLLERLPEELIIIPYEMGDGSPVDSNETRKGRAANRRVEFYFIPGPAIITAK